MALPLANNAAAGTNGATVTSGSGGNSGGASGNFWDQVGSTNGTAQFSSAVTLHSPMSYFFSTSATAGVGYVGWTASFAGAVTTAGGRAYVNLTGNPAATDANIQIRGSGSSSAGNIQINGSRQIVAQTPSFATAFTFTTALALNTWYRIEWKMVTGAAGAASFQVSLFAGDSTTVLETHTDTSFAWGGTGGVAETDYGWTNSHASQPGLYMADIQVNAVGMPGPSVSVANAGAAVATGTAGAPTVVTSSHPVDITVSVGPTVSRSQVSVAGPVQGDGKTAGVIQADGKSIGPTISDRRR